MRKPVKCRCLWCHEVFYLERRRIVQSMDGHRRGITCSDPCRRKQFKKWMLVGMAKDAEYQALMREREKLRRLVRQQRAA